MQQNWQLRNATHNTSSICKGPHFYTPSLNVSKSTHSWAVSCEVVPLSWNDLSPFTVAKLLKHSNAVEDLHKCSFLNVMENTCVACVICFPSSVHTTQNCEPFTRVLSLSRPYEETISRSTFSSSHIECIPIATKDSA